MFEIIYTNGKVSGVRRIADLICIPISIQNRDFRDFLEWNAAQPIPLDLSDKEPEPVVVDPDLILAVGILKAIPSAWKTGTQQQQIAWAQRRVLIEVRSELRD